MSVCIPTHEIFVARIGNGKSHPRRTPESCTSLLIVYMLPSWCRLLMMRPMLLTLIAALCDSHTHNDVKVGHKRPEGCSATSQFLPPPRRLCNARLLLSVCPLATLCKNYGMHLHENFVTDVLVVKEELITFWKSSRSSVWIRTPDPDQIRLGGGLRFPSAVVGIAVCRPIFS